MPEPVPRPKAWRYPKLISEHAFDRLRLLDCTFAEFEAALEKADVIEEHEIEPGALKEHPGFRREAFGRPWALCRENAAFTVALTGLLLASWRRWALALVLPYARLRLPRADHPRRFHLFAERVAVDMAQFVGMHVGALRYGLAVL
jgi:hypothetical protein